MSETIAMPEILDFLGIAQNVQVMHDDKSQWMLDGLNAAIENACRKAFRYRKQTTVTLTLKFTPGQMNQLEIDALVNCKEPKPESLTMLAYLDNQGRLFGEDPAQTKLPLDKPVELKRNKN
jgi:hypothetical protein